MPHIVVEYSANLRTRLGPQDLIDCVHQAALRTGVFPIGGTRTRHDLREQLDLLRG